MIVVLQSIVAFILVLGPLVFIHEFGHFIVAKTFGIGVPVFSLGFGPRIFGFRRGETDYRLSAIPLGGYVRLAGDEADENRRGLPEEFLSRPKWQRFLVFVAGAAFNVMLAFVALWFLFAAYGTEELVDPDSHPTVLGVRAGSPAERAGIKRGDTVLTFAGTDFGVENFQDTIVYEISLSPNTTKEIVVLRGDERLELSVAIEADAKNGAGLDPGWFLSFGTKPTPVIRAVVPGGRAAEAGLLAGDRILGAGGKPAIEHVELMSLLEGHVERPLELAIERDHETLSVTVVPRDEDGKGRIGVELSSDVLTAHRDFTLAEAARESFAINIKHSKLLFTVLKKMVTREVPLKSVSGPVGIAQYARDALITSPQTFIWLLAFFSLQLGVLNLLPIPVLDGGHILILFVEGLLRRELSQRLKERVMTVGFVFLIAFMGVVLYLDIHKMF